MKVIVKIEGFYAGTWHEAGPREIEMPDAIAKPFLPPFGAQLEIAKIAVRTPDKPVDKKV